MLFCARKVETWDFKFASVLLNCDNMLFFACKVVVPEGASVPYNCEDVSLALESQFEFLQGPG